MPQLPMTYHLMLEVCQPGRAFGRPADLTRPEHKEGATPYLSLGEAQGNGIVWQARNTRLDTRGQRFYFTVVGVEPSQQPPQRFVPVVSIEGVEGNAWNGGWFDSQWRAEYAGKTYAVNHGGEFCGIYDANKA